MTKTKKNCIWFGFGASGNTKKKKKTEIGLHTGNAQFQMVFCLWKYLLKNKQNAAVSGVEVDVAVSISVDFGADRSPHCSYLHTYTCIALIYTMYLRWSRRVGVLFVFVIIFRVVKALLKLPVICALKCAFVG